MAQTPTERVAAAIRGELARQRRTQRDLAEALGMAQQSVSRRLSGTTPISVGELDAISLYLGVAPAQLLGERPVSAA
jgi:transcriptional regulator with XRE-family HTH domain